LELQNSKRITISLRVSLKPNALAIKRNVPKILSKSKELLKIFKKASKLRLAKDKMLSNSLTNVRERFQVVLPSNAIIMLPI